jgi:hypothetical protein
MPQTPHTDQKHRAILLSIAQRAMRERGLLPDFSAAVLAELDRIQAPASVSGEAAGDLTKISLQYIIYDKFNGVHSNYDGF